MIYYQIISPGGTLTLSELKKIGELLKEWTNIEPDFITYLLNNSYFIGALDSIDDRLVGVAHLTIVNDPFYRLRWGRVEKIYVTPEYRNRGIARKIMEHLTTQAELIGCSFIRLDTERDNVAAQRLYEGLGFDKDYSFYQEITHWEGSEYYVEREKSSNNCFI